VSDHSRLSPRGGETTSRVAASFPIKIEAARAARAAVQPLRAQLTSQAALSLDLAVTELVANAYRHGGPDGRIELAAELGDSELLVRITNPRGATLPAKKQATEQAGWGLTLIDKVTAEWRVEEDDQSGLVTVWATIPL
jgi:anti-sigma regulatory factor (Ser/Thr protein kinase)